MYEFNISDPFFLPHRGCDIQLRVAPGVPIVLVGENGIGKSSLLQRMRNIHPDHSYLEQRPLEIFYDRKLGNISRIFSQVSSQLHKLRFERLWDEFGLSEKEDRSLSTLSGGEFQAIKICLTLSKETGLYFLDEPSQYLDEIKKQVLARHVGQLLAAQKALVIVEHDLSWLPGGLLVHQLFDENKILKVASA